MRSKESNELTMATNQCLHRFDTGFVPTANHAGDYITVTRKPLISCVSRQRPVPRQIEILLP